MSNNIKDTTSLVFVRGKNLFDKNNVLNGYRFGSDGMLFADSSYSASDFIKVSNSTQYTISWNIETRECVCYYDENKSFISRNASNKTFTTPSNCQYIRVSVATANINSAQIEQGSTVTTYEPYINKQIQIKNKNGVFEEFFNEDNINQDNHSLKEHKIGTWIDGKPLYRKVIQKTVASNTTDRYYLTDLGITNADLIIVNVGKSTAHYSNVAGQEYSPVSYCVSSTDRGNVFIDNYKRLAIANISTVQRIYYITLEYTKTTD